MIGFILQTAFVFAIFYYVPWFGDIVDEGKGVAATLAALIGSSLLTLLWEMLKAPKIMHDGVSQKLDDAETALGLTEASEAVTEEMLALCTEARLLREQGGNLDLAVLEEWKARALTCLHANYYRHFSYQFEHEIHLGNTFPSAPPGQRIETLVRILESAALSFGSKAEFEQQRFRPRG